MTFAIETRQLTKRFDGVNVVESVDLRVPRGTIHGYLGLNGAGKTTTIRMLATLLTPTRGAAIVDGVNVEDDPLAVRCRIGFVGAHDTGEAHPSWSALEYLGYFARIRAMPQAAASVNALLDRLGLDRRARGRAMGTYSTGMRRRVEIARGLLRSPAILFLDEPTRGLDLGGKREVWSLLRDLVEDDGLTIFLSSHETTEIVNLCDGVTTIAQGSITSTGRLQDFPVEPHKFEDSLLELMQAPEAAKP